MSQSKRNNIIFYGILLLIVISSILGTVFAIKLHNQKQDKKEQVIEEKVTPYLTFKEVSMSDTVDVFKKYPVNPIKINFDDNDKITISGLKDKQVQNKINEKLSTLKNEKNPNGNGTCSTNFNMSNVLSIRCGLKDVVNLNLVTGDEIELEDIFNKDSDIYSILIKSNYKDLCSWNYCDIDAEEDDDYSLNIENVIAEHLQQIKNKDYRLYLYENDARIYFNDFDDFDEYSSLFIDYYDYIDEITIYDRFIDNDIYENPVSDYCEPNTCYYKLNEREDDFYSDSEYLNDKTFLYYQVTNMTNYDASYSHYKEEKDKIDLSKTTEVILQEIINNENLSIKENDYVNYRLMVEICHHSQNDYQVIYTITKKVFSREEFKKYRLDFINAKTTDEKVYSKVNMLVDKNNKISYLNDNPQKEYADFEKNLYDYIIADINNKKDESNFFYYNTCQEDDYDCKKGNDYHKLIDDASYAIDTLNGRLYMYLDMLDAHIFESRIYAFIPLDIFCDDDSSGDFLEEAD